MTKMVKNGQILSHKCVTKSPFCHTNVLQKARFVTQMCYKKVHNLDTIVTQMCYKCHTNVLQNGKNWQKTPKNGQNRLKMPIFSLQRGHFFSYFFKIFMQFKKLIAIKKYKIAKISGHVAF